MSRNSRLAAFYSRSAQAYEELWAPELLPLSRSLVSRMELHGARRVLDVGTGVGTLLPVLQEAAGRRAFVVGVDLSFGMIQRAGPRFARAAMDATSLGFRAGVFDVATIAFVLFHIPRPVDALVEARRVLRNGGVVGTVTWGEDGPESCRALDVWNEELAAHGAPPHPQYSDHEPVNSAGKMKRLLLSARFGEPSTWTQTFVLETSPQEFLAHRTSHGASRQRLESLDEEARSRCLRRAAERLGRLGPDDFVDRTEVVFTIARAVF